MLIEVHMIQNHGPANLNRDDLGAPKTCYFGGVLRSRISSQCLKRSIRMSEQFKQLLGGVRTRRLAKLIAERAGNPNLEEKAERILQDCGFLPKKKSKAKQKSADNAASTATTDDETVDGGDSAALVYTTYAAIDQMIKLLADGNSVSKEAFAKLIAQQTHVPDMALSGRMLEPKKEGKAAWKGLDATVEASLQVAHAISTHAARPEVDYYVAADDIPGPDAGAGYVDEAMFASACFYKYFSVHWEGLVKNLNGNKELAAHTVGAFIRGAALTTPSGKQNSFAAHNPPDGILVEIRKSPVSYANAFSQPVEESNRGTGKDERDIEAQSIAQLGQYVHDLDIGYGKPQFRFWFSPNLRFPLAVSQDKQEASLAANNLKSLDELVPAVIKAIGHDWEAVQRAVVNQGAA